MIVKNNRDGICVVPVVNKAGTEIGKIILLPGNNEVEAELWKTAKVNVQNHLDRGILKELFAETPKTTKDESGKIVSAPTKAKEFSELTSVEAEKIVSETFNIAVLKKWKEVESRESVRIAINRQIDTIDQYGEDKKAKKTKKQESAE